MAQSNSKLGKILLIEDNAGDVRLFREMFREHQIAAELHVCQDGAAGLSYLKSATEPLPDLVILDLNLPKKNGREVLTEIRSDARLKELCVVVVSSSGEQSDVDAINALGVKSYLVKPYGLKDFSDIVLQIENYWKSAVNTR